MASLQISISVEEIHNLGLDRMRKQCTRSIAQDIGELIGECPWLNSFVTVSFDTAYRSFSGEVEASSTPTICRLSDSRRHQLSAIARRRSSPIDLAGELNQLMLHIDDPVQPGPEQIARSRRPLLLQSHRHFRCDDGIMTGDSTDPENENARSIKSLQSQNSS